MKNKTKLFITIFLVVINLKLNSVLGQATVPTNAMEGAIT